MLDKLKLYDLGFSLDLSASFEWQCLAESSQDKLQDVVSRSGASKREGVRPV
jgi:hypothetical protein